MRQEIFARVDPQPAALSPDDRRVAARASTVLLIGKVHDGRSTTPCLVLNVSLLGLMARIDFAAEIGQRVAVEMRGMPLASATIRWVNGTRAGMEFDHRQELTPIFCQLRDDSRVVRPPRFAVSRKAVLRIGERTETVRLVNISPGGVRLAADIVAERGQTGQIVVPGHDLCLFGCVRWVEAGEFGFNFSSPLPLASLRNCLDD